MTDERMALLELIEKGADADLVRELLAFASERLMAAEVDQLTSAAAGARNPDRINCRNGYRERSGAPLPRGDAGRPDRARYPEAAQELVLPGVPRAAPHGRESADGGHPSSAARSIHAPRGNGREAIAGGADAPAQEDPRAARARARLPRRGLQRRQ